LSLRRDDAVFQSLTEGPHGFIGQEDSAALLGDAVLIAPVSSKIPYEQGILQGNSDIFGSFERRSITKSLSRRRFSSNSLRELTGKLFRAAGNLVDPYRDLNECNSAIVCFKTLLVGAGR
jgi:hypothetical protein